MFRSTDTIEYYGRGHSGIINRLLSENIEVISAKSQNDKLILRTYSRDRQKIIVLFDALCYNYKIIKVDGARAVAAFLRRRWLLPLAAICIIVMLALIPRLVYTIRVESDAVDENAVLSAIEEEGVRRGVFIGNIDFDAVLRKVERLDGVAFADIIVKGSTVTISVKSELPHENIIDLSARGAVTSQYDAVISRQLIFSGAGVFNAGDVVRKGDTLITSEIPIGDSTVTVRPAGEVYGLVTYKAAVLFTSTRVERVKSGASHTECVTDIMGLCGRPRGSPYPMYETRVVTEKSGFLVPLTVRRITYYEIIDREITSTFEEAEEGLKAQALASAQSALPDAAVVKNKVTTIRHTGAGTVVEAVITAEQRIDVP